MAYKNFDDFSGHDDGGNTPLTLTIDGDTLDLPDASFVRDADIQRDGMDLVLHGPDGTIVVEGYFAAEPAPDLIAPGGETLTPALVQSFAHGSTQYADAGSMNDASPVGAIQEVTGDATVTRLDGSVETITKGTSIYQGDVVETSGDGAVNIVFADQTSFAVSEGARLAIDEYVYDPSSQSGTSNFSVLKGVFVFTSGLIGREDPDDVEIDTPVGSIGIRGTIIMGDVNSGEITVVEGAIVLRDLQGHEITLSNQFETGKFLPDNGGIEHMGIKSANDMSHKFVAVSTVAPELFSSLNDANAESTDDSSGESGEGDLLLNEDAPTEEQGENTNDVIQKPDGLAPDVNPFTGQQDGLLNVKPPIGLRPHAPQNGEGQNHDLNGVVTHQNAPLQVSNPLSDTPPPLAVNVQVFGLNENTSNAVVARLVGSFSPNVTFTLTGPNVGDYQLFNITATTADVKYIGTPRDFESNPGALPPVGFRATNDSGAITLNGVVNAPLKNLFDETPVLNLDYNLPPEHFSASEGTTWKINLNDLFKDKEIVHGDVLTYQLDGATISFLTSLGAKIASIPNVNLTTGDITGNTLEINFANFNFTANALGGAFNITAKDIGGNTVTLNNTFDVYDANTTGPNITGTSQVYSTVSTAVQNLLISGTNNKIFSGSGDDMFNVGGTGHEIHGGFGNDHITVSNGATDNILIGNHGSDTFAIEEVDNQFYGMEGDDIFQINLAVGASTDLATGSTTLIDGGTDFLSLSATTGGDTLKFSGAGNIDFTAINNAFIKNIESIDTQNSSTNALIMNFSDIFDMTDSRKTLVIDMEAGDSFTFNASGETINNTGTLVDGADVFNVYEINAGGGNSVTLLVDQAASVTGLP